MSADAARQLSLEVLASVLDKSRPLDEAFDKHPDLTGLDMRDRGFARMLITTCLRRLGQIDDLLNRCLDKPLPASGKMTRHILRLGTTQLFFMEVAEHGAVSTSVDLAVANRQTKFKGLINAILRRLAREGSAWLAAQDEARLVLPDWLWESWGAAYGEEVTRDMALAHLDEPALDISVKSDAEGWAERLEAEVLINGSLRLRNAGPVHLLPGFEDGAWWVQDVAAALPVSLLGDVSGKTVLDLCAAPGGKTLQLASAGARVIAVDRSAPRLKRLQQNLARTDLSAAVVTADLTQWDPGEKVDAILLDAPCSATGTLRRHPDGLWNKTPADIPRLASLQARLLDRAMAWLKPGGKLVFCTCSLQPEEGQNHFSDRPSIGFHDPGPMLAPFERSKGLIQVWPSRASTAFPGGSDGFFMTCLV